MITIENLSVYYENVQALNGLTLHWPPGKLIGLHGANGAGKSTVLKVCAGIVRRYEGRVLFKEKPVEQNLFEIKRATYYVPENAGILPYLSGREFLQMIRALYGRPADDALLEHLLEISGLKEKADDPGYTYSHGMRQKLFITAALISGAEALFFDEAFNGVDQEGTAALLNHIRNDFLTASRLVVISSHQHDFLHKWRDISFEINNGMLEAETEL
ncbi:MAG TPA: ABC transporter ATP-binding protein [Caldithrix abyssi]|uniref:ABC transporter ATP-binding protein n=1 Tax=Caldithrix abyssi TaxID=187145 RepID=A0A7V1LZU8_CALAY|nr:ABC transporter ATP-binding protein [Caldithrix abyssi]